jgi:DNA polymerase-1
VAKLAEGQGIPKSHVTDDDVADFKQQGIEALTPPGFTVTKVGRLHLDGYWTRKGRGLKKPGRTKTATATDSPVLRRYFYEDQFVLDLLNYRKVNKALQYVEAYPTHTVDGRMYGHFDRTGTVTGRLSSSDPNLMNVPSRGEIGKAIRGLFRGDLIVGDHSQLEVRILAHLSQDPNLIRVFLEGRDLYLETAQAIFGGESPEYRAICKEVVLSDQYGAQADTVAGRLTIAGYPTKPEVAAGYLYELHNLFPRAQDFKQEVADFARRTGFVKTMGGRPRRLHYDKRPTWKSGFDRTDRQAVNSVIQGSAADILQDNMLATRDVPGARLLVQVHDELVWEFDGVSPTHSTLDDLKGRCEAPRFKISVPLKFEASFCSSWADKG